MKAEYDRINYTLAGRTDEKFREEAVADKVQNPAALPLAMPPPVDEYISPSDEHDSKTSMPYIEFHRPWGKKSWIVKFNGPYENYRNGTYVPMHVELVDEEDVKDPQNLHKTMKSGARFQLIDLKKTSRWVRWTVKDCFKKNPTPCHFTVHYGPKALRHFQIQTAASEKQRHINPSDDQEIPVTQPEAFRPIGERESRAVPSTPNEAFLPPKVSSHDPDLEPPSTPEDAKMVDYEQLRKGRRIHEENGRYYFYDTIGRKYGCDEAGNKMWTSKRRPPQYDAQIWRKLG